MELTLKDLTKQANLMQSLAPFLYILECYFFCIVPILHGFWYYLNAPRHLYKCLWIDTIHFPLTI